VDPALLRLNEDKEIQDERLELKDKGSLLSGTESNMARHGRRMASEFYRRPRRLTHWHPGPHTTPEALQAVLQQSDGILC
jgi:hypothetical protein